jgi:hypothetical protein
MAITPAWMRHLGTGVTGGTVLNQTVWEASSWHQSDYPWQRPYSYVIACYAASAAATQAMADYTFVDTDATDRAALAAAITAVEAL